MANRYEYKKGRINIDKETAYILGGVFGLGLFLTGWYFGHTSGVEEGYYKALTSRNVTEDAVYNAMAQTMHDELDLDTLKNRVQEVIQENYRDGGRAVLHFIKEKLPANYEAIKEYYRANHDAVDSLLTSYVDIDAQTDKLFEAMYG